jgi:hypothetical protein
MTAARTDEEKAYDAANERNWRSSALSAAASELGEVPTSTPEERSKANQDLLKIAEKYYKFYAASKGDTDAASVRTNALQTAKSYPVEGKTTLERAQDILDFLVPA